MNLEEYESLKIGDDVVFTKYDSESKWEKDFGGFVGKQYCITAINSTKSIHLSNGYGEVFVVDKDQVEFVDKTKNSEDLVNNPKHYATDPSGVECIQIKRKMSANAGDAFKYCWRLGKKWDDKQDLEKALWYINDAIEHDVPVWLDDGVDLETETLVQQVLKHREGWQYMFINAMYWSDLQEAKRAVEIGIVEIDETNEVF